jgi:hypothetical protein
MSRADDPPVPPLDADELIAQARQATGLSDFGEPDPDESLRTLVRSLNEEASLTPEGAAGKRLGLIRVLANRLLLQEEFRRDPSLAAERIRSPIVILGLPRSGTTKLHRMIGADPTMQKLPLWRLLYPVRALAPTGSGGDPRIGAAEQFVEAIRSRSPEAYAAHPMYATEPDEEYFGMEVSFLSHLNTSSFHTPSYETWLDRQPFDSWYTWLKRFLQYAQHTDRAERRPWVLKAPHHLGYLPLLFEHFRDATVVHCHRDPNVAVSSFCALLYASRRSTSTRDEPAEVGQYVMRAYGRRMHRYQQDRAQLERSHRFFDVPYQDIVADAPTVIARCYAAAGLPLEDSSLAAMREWESRNEQHKHGRHRYELADFGLTPADVTRVFSPYCARFAEFLR